MIGGDVEHVFMPERKWETIVMEKYLEFDPDRGAYTDRGSMMLFTVFGETFNLVSSCIVAEIEEMTPRILDAIQNPEEV
jgi:hypothetical protein